MADPRILHCAEFHMTHDPETKTVNLVLVSIHGDGQRASYTAEGTYEPYEDPVAELDLQVEPAERNFGSAWTEVVAGQTYLAAGVRVARLTATKPVERRLLGPPVDAALDPRRAALVEAYWKLRDHAAGLRDTTTYRRAKAAFDADKTKRGYVALSWRCLGMEAGARLIAELLGIEEHEIERPTS